MRRLKNYLTVQASPRVANKVASDIRAGIRRLAQFPGIGHERADLSEGVRFYLVHSYYIVYRPNTKPLQIIRVIHAARDVPRILED
jgi:plasmid stabilization system protein ParE